MIQYFPQRRQFRDGTTWRTYRNGAWLRSTCDYVFSDDSRKRFRRVRITDPRNYDSDHLAICFTLIAKNQKHQRQYVQHRKAFPLHTNPALATTADELRSKFPALHLDPKQRTSSRRIPQQSTVPRTSWISDYTWRLIDTRASFRRLPQPNPTSAQHIANLSQQIRKALRRDRKRRVIAAGEDIESLLNINDVRGAWTRLRGWYRQASTKTTKPSLADMNAIHTTFSTLYAKPVDLPTTEFPIHYVAEDIPDDPPTDFEIQMAVQKLRLHKAPGPSGLRSEEILQWMKNDDKQDWNNLTTLIRHIFTTGQIPQRLSFSTLVLLPKPDGGIRGIGLLEPIWKVISIIIKDRIVETVQFDDALHGFLPRRGTGTAIIEAKLHLDSQTATGQTTYQAFLDISKAYDSVCRHKLLHLLKRYGAGPNIIKILETFWHQLWVAPRQAGFYGPAIKSDRGVTQGYPLSPILFNIIIDAVVRATKHQTRHLDGNIIFYADDGLIVSNSLENIQQYLDILNNFLAQLGLKANAIKTKILVGRPTIYNHRISSPVFNRRFGGNETSYTEYQQQIVHCTICHQQLQRASLPLHMLLQHNEYARPERCSTILPRFAETSQTYYISMDSQNAVDCPVITCPANYTHLHSMRQHFNFRHWNDKVVIIEDGEVPQCPSCLLYGKTVLSARHKNSQVCQDGTLRHQRRLQQLHNETAENADVSINDTIIEHVDTFKYLGRYLSATSNDIVAVNHNLRKATKTWGRLSTILKREGANKQTMGNIYKTIIQASLLYTSETWHIPKHGLHNIQTFHHKVARHLTNRHITKIPNTEIWLYPDMNKVLQELGLLKIEDYIQKRKKKLMTWAQNRTIYHEVRTLAELMGNSRSFWGIDDHLEDPDHD
jgi:Reverse transcriptase (RNA-dependent DNA polymerase)